MNLTNSIPSPEKGRNDYFDILRAIAIVFVVCIHVYNRIPVDTPIEGILATYWRVVISSSVPLFIAISGYFMANKDVSTPQKYFAFIKKQVPRVYIPCFVWSLPYFYWEIKASGFSWMEVVNLLFCGYSNYYFVLLIIIFYFLLPFFQRLGSTIRGVIISTIISFIAISVWGYLIGRYFDFQPPLLFSAFFFPMWMMFYVIGIYFGKNKSQGIFKNFTASQIFPMLVTVLAGGFILFHKEVDSPEFKYSLQKAIHSLFSLMLIFVLFRSAPANIMFGLA